MFTVYAPIYVDSPLSSPSPFHSRHIIPTLDTAYFSRTKNSSDLCATFLVCMCDSLTILRCCDAVL